MTAPDADGWIEWSGGECPVGIFTFVQVRFRNGGEGVGPAGHWVDRWSDRWSHYGPLRSEDIVAYRVRP